ncbi:MAG: 50S ribosomal protein L28 [Saprospiraceae bacterium]|jgi:large subunit ribosomal protein L28|nr:50S ribosomal protein L28 [Saprospiraceae bacterium]MBK6565430.1 50S ribosomal protein L28 [Saprospiraceae bacterium]MBK7522699.1 50S ribosomal protein L28 [Saprospiraceae bacterium]MBK8079987.1 50S ribosomal protein L28 [Saprospiraceae bacterium]MBK8370877.1 50S ribosomal protein L28 [Saprospiraceae bacterium]
MSRVCQLSGKKPMSGHKVSHSNVKTKRRFLPNLFSKRFFIPETGEWVKLKVSNYALRIIDKKGLYEYLKELKAKGVDTGVKI